MLPKKAEPPNTSDLPEVDFAKAKVVRRGYGKPVRMSLRALREATGKTQDTVAAELKKDQAAISKLEHRDDALLSTIEEYVGALGGRVEVVASFPDGKRIVVETKGGGRGQ